MTKGETRRLQRLWALAAKERWKRHLAAQKGAATRKRKQLAAVERQVAAVQLDEATATAKSALLIREAEATVKRLQEIAAKPAITMAEKDLHNRAFESADKEIKRLKNEKLYSSEHVEIRQKAQAEVVLGKEMVEQAVLDFYEKAKAEGRIERISRFRKPGSTTKAEYRERHGYVADRRSGMLLSEQNIEETLHQMLRAAEVIGKRQKGGKLYATFSYFEYGKDVPRSGYVIPVEKGKDPSIKGSIRDEFGQFFQSFDATNYLGAADDATALEIKLRAVLERKLKEGAGRNAAVLIGFQMKTYIERTQEEREGYDRGVWRKLKAAQRKAEKLKQKAGEPGETQWIDIEDVKKE